MIYSKKLYIDKVCENFRSDNDLVLGPWCLKDDFSIDKIFEFKTKGIFFESDLTNNIEAYCKVEDQHKRLLKEISIHMREINNEIHSIEFYKNFLNYWLYFFINLLHFSNRVAQLYISKFKDENIEIIKYYKNENIIFNNVNEFYYKTSYDELTLSNLILELIKDKIPNNWKITYLNNSIKNKKEIVNEKKIDFKNNIFRFLERLIFPRVRKVYGFSKFEKLLISLLLLIKKPIKNDLKNKKCYSNLKVDNLTPPISDEKLLKLIKKYSPLSFKEIFKNKIKKKNFDGKIILCSASSLNADEVEQFKLFSFKENGGKLFSVQHGSSYGDLFFQGNQSEYSLDKFISWGHKTHQNFDFIFDPLPSPQLKKMKQSVNADKILFVSITYLFYGPRYGTRDFTDSFLRYKDTIEFFDKIKPELVSKFEFKDMHYGHFSEVDQLKKKHTKLKFVNEKPEISVNNSKLVVINNYSTFFYKCLASNIPTILITKPDTWRLNDNAKEVFKKFKECGILFYDAESAAKKINFEFDKINYWWNDKETQKARELFCREFAWSSKNYFKEWINYLWKI
jgi:putative transferase (TIGR04331 family)